MRHLLVSLVLLAIPAPASAGTVSLADGVLRYSGTDSLRVAAVVSDQGSTLRGCTAAGEHACVSGYASPTTSGSPQPS